MSLESRQFFIENVRQNIRATIHACFHTGLRILLCLLLTELILSYTTTGYRLQVYDNELTGGWPVAVDASGQRGIVVPQKKAENEYRILVLGDSVSFGTGVSAADSWPGQLSELIDGHGRKITCINAAMPGRSVKDNLADYREHWSSHEPDLVLLAVTNNMVALSWSQRSKLPTRPANEYLKDVSKSGFAKFRIAVKQYSKLLVTPSWVSTQVQRISYLAGLSNHNLNASEPFGPMLAYGYLQADLPPSTADDAWSQFELDLRDFCDEVDQSCGDVRIVTFPTRFMLSDKWIDNEKCVPVDRLTINSERTFAECCARIEVPVLETGLAFREQMGLGQMKSAGDWYLHFDFTHLTPLAHELVASFVASAVAADEPWIDAQQERR